MYSHNHSYIINIGGDDGMIRIWNMKTGDLLGIINAHTNAMITSIVVSMVHTNNTQERTMTSNSNAGSMLGLKSLPSPKQQQQQQQHQQISVLRPMIVSCGRDNKCCVFDLQAEGSPVEGIFV